MDELISRSEPMHANGGKIEGGSPLAGHHGLPSLLVREAVQNSWDARDDARGPVPVRFSIDGHDLDTDALDGLRAVMPVERLSGFDRTSDTEARQGVLHPQAVLDRASVRVLVLSDRRTVGLCGPSRSGQRWDPVRHGKPLARGQQRFANFIRNVGRATSNIGEGDGGSYGIGKSALWMASECGTVLIHSRTTDAQGDPVERFIGAVHGEHFYDKDREFTGRHFIGREGDGVIEPLTGAAAAVAARSLPIPLYADGDRQVDGTSIVIVAPRLHLPWATEMDRLRDAVRWQVWPKRVAGVREPHAPPDMEFSLSWNNHPVPLLDPLEDPEIRPYVTTLLDCARDRNSPDEDRDVVAQCHRPKTTLGLAKFRPGGKEDRNVFHVTVSADELEQIATKAGLADDEVEVDDEPAVDFAKPWGQLAIIRREPLLLVQYQKIGGSDATGTEVGIFLSADDPDVEAALTRAEPPAHDEWSYKIVPKDHSRDHRRTLAKRTIEEVKRAKNVFASSFRQSGGGDHGAGEQAVSRVISEGLMGGLGGGAAPPKPKNGNVSGVKPVAELLLLRTYEVNDRTVHEVQVTLKGVGATARPVRLVAGGKGRDNTGSLDASERVAFQWLLPAGEVDDGPTVDVDAADGWRGNVVVRVAGALRFRPKVTVESTDAD